MIYSKKTAVHRNALAFLCMNSRFLFYFIYSVLFFLFGSLYCFCRFLFSIFLFLSVSAVFKPESEYCHCNADCDHNSGNDIFHHNLYPQAIKCYWFIPTAWLICTFYRLSCEDTATWYRRATRGPLCTAPSCKTNETESDTAKEIRS